MNNYDNTRNPNDRPAPEPPANNGGMNAPAPQDVPNGSPYRRSPNGAHETVYPHNPVAAPRTYQNMQPPRRIPPVTIRSGLSSLIGSRASQQDAARVDNESMYCQNNLFLAVMCDGMGGMSGGEIASNLCVTRMFEAFYSVNVRGKVPSFFKFMVDSIDKMVYDLVDENGRPRNSGTTLTAVIVEGGSLFWVSVGDSRIYLKRGGEMMPITVDHNYAMLLEKKVKAGMISREEAMNDPNREALVSYMGIGGVPYIDINPFPFALQNGDTILLCSDGLYRSLSDSEICLILNQVPDPQRAAETLTSAAIAKGRRHQDNTTAVVVKFCDSANYPAPQNVPINS